MFGKQVVVKATNDGFFFIYYKAWSTLGQWIMTSGPAYTSPVKAEADAVRYAKCKGARYIGLKAWWEL